jgi:hypothetical protein
MNQKEIDKYFKKENTKSFILEFYKINQAEITRYRDREWALPGIFVAAMIAVIGFILNNSCVVQHQWFAFWLLLIVLAIGNTFFLLYTHKKLMEQRIIRKKLEKNYFQLHKINAQFINEDKFRKENLENLNYCSNWNKGFWDHVFWFIIAGWVLLGYGSFLIAVDYFSYCCLFH